MHESSMEFEFLPDLTNDCGVFSAMPDQILFILAGNDDIHKSLDEFVIRSDPIRDHRLSCS